MIQKANLKKKEDFNGDEEEYESAEEDFPEIKLEDLLADLKLDDGGAKAAIVDEEDDEEWEDDEEEESKV